MLDFGAIPPRVGATTNHFGSTLVAHLISILGHIIPFLRAIHEMFVHR